MTPSQSIKLLEQFMKKKIGQFEHENKCKVKITLDKGSFKFEIANK